MEEFVRAIQAELMQARHGEKAAIVLKYSRILGVSEKTLYRKLQGTSGAGRKTRSDKGSSRMDEKTLKVMSAMMYNSVRGNGKQTMDIPTAKQIMTSQGYDVPVSDSRLSVLLKENCLDVQTLKQPSPCIRMRSLHPNHVHQVDPSLCLLYYAPDGTQHMIRDEEAYKNKPFMEGKEKLKLWRYVLVDHTSGTIIHRYYNVAGENQLTLWEFLLYAWGKKDNMSFHGLPEILIWDKGSANTSRSIANACRSLRVKTIPHATENPRAKGAVENANNLVEKLFESRLKLQPVGSVEELNEYAAQWDMLYNANLLKGYDSRLTRGSFRAARTDIWLTIKPEELTELPEDAQGLLVRSAEKRTVKGDLSFSYCHPRLKTSALYTVAGLPGVRPKMEIDVQPVMVSTDGSVIVNYSFGDEVVEEELLPVAIDDAGFRLDAPVFGMEFKRNADTVADRRRKQLDDLIGDERRPFATVEGSGIRALDAVSPSAGMTIFTPPRAGGQQMEIERPVRKLTVTAAAMHIKARIGFFEPWMRETLTERYAQGVPETDLDRLCEEMIRTHKEDAKCSG